MNLLARGVEFGYSRLTTISDVTFSADAGDVLAIMGPNGAGKTTLLKCLNRILEPRGGSILIGSEDARTLSRREIARRIGYVPQRAEVSRITVYDLVLLGRIPRIGWAASAHDHQIVTSVIEQLGLGHLAIRYADELSGGEFQLVQVARALVQEPRVILLDEPTSSLDISNQHRLLSTIRQTVVTKSMAAVMAVHDINLALRYSNRFLLMRDGAVYAAGGREIITPENMQAVFHIDVHVGQIDGFTYIVPL